MKKSFICFVLITLLCLFTFSAYAIADRASADTATNDSATEDNATNDYVLNIKDKSLNWVYTVVDVGAVIIVVAAALIIGKKVK